MSNLVPVYQSQFLHEIYLIKHKLEENGIICYVRNENVTATIGVSMLEQHKLMINENDLEKAVSVIDNTEFN
ncbi:MAG: putative signal transducing protein [Flavobacteriales bacterium]